MTNRIPLAMVATAAIAFSGCARDKPADDPAKIAGDIKALEAKWEQAFAAKDGEAIAGFYTDDAEIVEAGAPVAASNTERRKAIQALLTDPNFKLTFASDREVSARSGDLDYSRGHYSITTTDTATNKPVSGSGSFLTVWQRQSDGSWKAAEDFITPGPAATSAAAK
jgi:uncharacterized protein (TIGR02246 family)